VKKILFAGLTISLVCFVTLIANHTDLIGNTAVYESLVKDYGHLQLFSHDSKILYSMGLRRLTATERRDGVYVNLPGMKMDYNRQMGDFMRSDAQMIVECSGLDSWHTSREGSGRLTALQKKAYRVVIFDGGHHLPTLGMAPDIIIVPAFKGYAVHGYMQDGMRVDKILEILKANHIPTVLATVSRWRLVKTESSLQDISREVWGRLDFATEEPPPFTVRCRPRISKYGGHLFIYVSQEYIKQPDMLIKNCRQLGLKDVVSAYVAFNYSAIEPTQAKIYARKLEKKLGLKAEVVNEPVKVSNLFFKVRNN
jgi:hypothetical protein